MIGGIGPAATEFYYRNLVRKYASANKIMDITIVHADAVELVRNIEANSPDKQASIFHTFARRLEAAGADNVVISSIAGHFCIREFEELSPLPIVSVIPALDAEFIKRKFKRVGLLGNRISMESKLFGGILSAEVVVPLGEELDLVHSLYIEMAISGRVGSRQRELLFDVGKSLCDKQGAEAVVLAGTDLFLAFDGQECGFNIIDSALVHIDALCERSIESTTNKAMHRNS